MIKIPAFDLPSYTIDATLEDLAWTLRFDYNTTSDMWVMSIADAAKVYQLRGVTIVPNYPILEQFHHLPIPVGEFVCAAGERNAQIGRMALLDGTADLYYVPGVEYASL